MIERGPDRRVRDDAHKGSLDGSPWARSGTDRRVVGKHDLPPYRRGLVADRRNEDADDAEDELLLDVENVLAMFELDVDKSRRTKVLPDLATPAREIIALVHRARTEIVKTSPVYDSRGKVIGRRLEEELIVPPPVGERTTDLCCVTQGSPCTPEDPCVCCAARSAAPALPNETQNNILAWIDNDGNELADDAIVKLTSATGRAFSHVTAGWLKRFITATNGTRFGACPTCGRPHGEHTHNEQKACDHA